MLKAGYDAGEAVASIARRLRRSASSVKHRAHRMGFRHPEKMEPDGTSQPLSTYSEFRSALAAVRKQRGLTQLFFDDLAGLPGGYTGKLECGRRSYGPKSFDATMRALGIGIVIVQRARPRRR
jgi:hypothetical protein